ncbi:MAG: hypothetical protein AAFO94_09300 [Bacteroidota bacterium]
MKYLLSSILLLFVGFQALAQQKGTTLEEFRYLSKGIAYQIEMGLDKKKDGYVVRQLFQTSNSVAFMGLYAEKDEELRGMTAVLNPSSSKPEFLGIPNTAAKEVVLNMYYEQKYALSTPMQRQLDAAQREWQFAELGAPSKTPTAALAMTETPRKMATDEQFTAKGSTEEIPAEYNIPAVEIDKAIPLAPQKMRPAEVSLSGDLSTRSLVTAPVVVDQPYASARLAVKVCAGPDGQVHYARYTMRGSTSMDPDLKVIAVKSAKAARFANSDSREECGIMTFEF